ncbi:MAG: DUF368 domain-containing protein [Bacteroidota bacterium]
MKSFLRCLLLFFKGVGIGSADVVPGISGSTIALIIGVYEELLASIQSFNITALRLLTAGHFKALWQHLHGTFLLPLLGGIGLGIATAARVVVYLLTHYPIQTWSFLGGLLLVATFTIYEQIKQWNLHVLFLSLGGFLLAYGVTQVPPLHTPNASWFIGITGAIAVCAMLLPGVSGSFMLLLLGKYALLLEALKALNIGILAAFSVGGVIGLLVFSRLIAWLLRQYHDTTMAFLAGFMVSAIHRLWPWQALGDPLMLSSSMTVTQKLSPMQFQIIYQRDPLVAQALLWMSLGILLIMGLKRQVRSKA